MRSPQERFQKSSWMIMPLLAVMLAVGYLKYSDRIKADRHHSKSAKIILPSNASDEQELSLSLLTDSILSIVQSYYVDRPRVTNLKIVSSTLENMNLIPGVETKFDSEQNKIIIKIFDNEVTYNISNPFSYAQLLNLFQGMASFIDHSKPLMEEFNSGERIGGSILVLNSLLTALDAHSSLLSPEAYRELRQGTEGSFGGLGVIVGIRDNVLTVIKPLPRSPALRSGILKDDY